tara:strand:+ start:1633 stop:1848 length:216 start_codon:yes stop_codon:yes gene_type:complete
MDILKTFNKMNLDEKKEMLEYIVFKDTLVFNEEHKTLDEGSQVAHVCINGDMIQLTIHPESNIAPEFLTSN